MEIKVTREDIWICLLILLVFRRLGFISINKSDKNGLTVPTATNNIKFEIESPGEIVATDNGDPTDFVPFSSYERKAFSELALVIIRSKAGKVGLIKITAKSPGLKETQVAVKSYLVKLQKKK